MWPNIPSLRHDDAALPRHFCKVMNSETQNRSGKGRFATGGFGQKVFLVASALCLGLGLVSSYVNIQDRAERELALRMGPPKPIVMQNFDPETDLGRVGEVAIHSEIDLSAAFLIKSEAQDSSRSMLVIPMHPISDTGAVSLVETQNEDDAVRTQQEVRRAPTHALAPEAEGFLLVPFEVAVAKGEDRFFFADEVHGEGRFGTVVTLSGDALSETALRPGIDRSLASLGIARSDRYILVKPFLNGRSAALSGVRPSQNYQWFFVLSGILALVAGVMHLAEKIDLGRPRTAQPTGLVNEDETAGHPRFARIPTQSEILEADRRSAEEQAMLESAHTPLSKVFRALGFAGKSGAR